MWKWLSVLGATLWVTPLLAQTEPYFPSNQLDMPARSDGLLAVEPAGAMSEAFQLSGRISYLNAPISLRLGAPAQPPTRGPVVSDVLLVEAAVAARLAPSLDVGATVVWYAFQDGEGLSGVVGAGTLAPTALGDARLQIGYAWQWDEWGLRPFAIAHLPTGNASQFAGQGSFHGEFGLAFGRSTPDFEVSVDVRAHLREPRSLGLFRLGQQLRFALGARYRLGALSWLGLEGYLAPLLDAQPAPEQGQPALALPAELLAHTDLELDRWVGKLGLGVGLPLGHLSSVSGNQGGYLAPATPTIRALLEVRYQF